LCVYKGHLSTISVCKIKKYIMKKLLLTLICVFTLISNLKSQIENLIASDYVETYDWFGAWFTPAATAGYFTNISVSPDVSAAIYGTGNNVREQDWYSLPAVTVDPFNEHIFRMRLAAQTISNPTASTAGLDGGDYITVQLSQDGGSFVSELRVTGFSNATWDYSSTATASKVANGSITEFTPAGGGDRTLLGDGYSYIELYIPAGASSIAIDVYCRVNRGGEDWWMDNFELYEISSTPLPIELISFEGHDHEGCNHLDWATASEANTDYYDVEWSRDAYVWESIGIIPAAGNSNMTLYYNFVDESPLPIVNYYRLVQYDWDGMYEIFGPIAIDNRKKEKRIVKYVNISGQEVSIDEKGLIFLIWDNGDITKKFNP